MSLQTDEMEKNIKLDIFNSLSTAQSQLLRLSDYNYEQDDEYWKVYSILENEIEVALQKVKKFRNHYESETRINEQIDKSFEEFWDKFEKFLDE